MFAPCSRSNFPARRACPRRAAGFNLVEVSIGVAVIGILIVSFYTMLANGFSLVRTNRENLRASQILLNRMEGIRLYTWSQLVYSNAVPATFTEYYYPLGNSNSAGIVYTGSLTISDAVLNPPATYATNKMKSVTVDLTWNTGGIKHSRSMSTLVSEYGVQNYIYTH